MRRRAVPDMLPIDDATRARWEVEMINTHIMANYSGDWARQGVFARMQERQLRQLADTIAAQPANALVVAVGDFNLPRGSRLYTDFLHGTGLMDTLAADLRPTHRPPPGVPAHYSLPIDFVFVRAPQTLSLQITSDLRFSSKLDVGRKYQDYLSDHNAIEVSFAINSPSGRSLQPIAVSAAERPPQAF